MKISNEHDLLQLVEQHKIDIGSIKEKHKLEMESKEKEHHNELECKEKELENISKYKAMRNIMKNSFGQLIGDAINSTEIKDLLNKEMSKAFKINKNKFYRRI